MSQITNWGGEEYTTDREVGGIVYRISQVYSGDEEGKGMAMREAYFERVSHDRFARAMRVKTGSNKGLWACYVSYVKRGE